MRNPIGAAAVHGAKRIEHPLHTGGERLVRVVHIGPKRVAAMTRDLFCIKDGPHRRRFEEAEIRMPGIAEGTDVPLVRFLEHGDDVRVLIHVLYVRYPQ